MIQQARFIRGQLDYFLCAWSETNFAEYDPITATNDEFNGTTHFIKFDAKIMQDMCGNTSLFTYQSQQQVFRTNVIVLETLGLLLCIGQHAFGSHSEPVNPAGGVTSIFSNTVILILQRSQDDGCSLICCLYVPCY